MITLGILLVYDILVSRGLVPASEGITQYQSNQIRAERYFDGEVPRYDVVMVGSSLTDNIRSDYVGSEVYNLGMSGGSPCTGLRIVAEGKLQPKIVLVEMSPSIGYGADNDLIRSVTSPTLTKIDNVFPMMRIEYQPVSVIVNCLKKREQSRLGSVQNRDKELSVFDPVVRARMVDEVVKQGSASLSTADRADLVRGAVDVKDNIRALEERGIHVILQVIPGENRVAQTVRERQVMAVLDDEFPAGQYDWLAPPPPREWVTKDGIHLTKEEAGVYGGYVKSRLGKYLNARVAAK